MRRKNSKWPMGRLMYSVAVLLVTFGAVVLLAACGSSNNNNTPTSSAQSAISGAKTQAQTSVSGAKTQAQTSVSGVESTVQSIASQGASAVLGARTGVADAQTQFAATATAIANSVSNHAGTFDLDEQDDSGISGKAVVGSAQDKTVVLLYLNGDTDTHAAGIYTGSCDNPGGKAAYSLNDVRFGLSVSSVDVGLGDLRDGNHVILVHKSSSADSDTAACASIPKD